MNILTRILRTPLGIAAVVMLTLVVATAIFAPILWGEEAAAVDTDNMLAGPSLEHPIGTDQLGRDLLLRVLVATRLSVTLAVLATLVAVSAGLILGVAPLLLGRHIGRGVTWLVGVAVAFPGLLLALSFAVIFGSGWLGAVLAIGLAGAPSFARLCQTLIAGVASRDFVAAARIGGVGRFRVLTRHVLPNIGEPLIVNATIGAGGALLAFAGLSFIGLGVQPPDYDWGRHMMEGLLEAIRERDDVALLLISHDVSVVAEVCDRVLVMYAGRIVEDLPAADLATAAKHPYTRALLAAVPDMDTHLHLPLATIAGRPVDPAQLPEGCAYAARCPLADARCRAVDPHLATDEDGGRVACWRAGEPLPLGMPQLRTGIETNDTEGVLV